MLVILGMEIALAGAVIIWGGLSGYMASILYALWYGKAPGSSSSSGPPAGMPPAGSGGY